MGGRGKKAQAGGGAPAAAAAPATPAERAAAEDNASKEATYAENALQVVRQTEGYMRVSEDRLGEQVQRSEGANNSTRTASEQVGREIISNARSMINRAELARSQAQGQATRAEAAAAKAGTPTAAKNAQRAREAANQANVDFQARLTRMQNRLDVLVQNNNNWRAARARGPAPRSAPNRTRR